MQAAGWALAPVAWQRQERLRVEAARCRRRTEERRAAGGWRVRLGWALVEVGLRLALGRGAVPPVGATGPGGLTRGPARQDDSVRLLRIGDGRIACDDDGRGPTVLFAHAAIADRRMWEAQYRALAVDHRVVRHDRRGIGDSDDAAGPVRPHEDLLAVLDALDVADAVLVGCSMGGAHVLDAALTAPDRVRGLVLVSPGLSGHVWPPAMQEQAAAAVRAAVPAERLAAYLSGTATEVRPEDVDAVAHVQARLLVAGPRRSPGDVAPAVWDLALTMLRGVLAREWSAPPVRELPAEPPAAGRLAEVTAPTVVVNGTEDLPWIQKLADELTAGIPGARRVDLAGTAHLSPVERPDEVLRAVRAVL